MNVQDMNNLTSKSEGIVDAFTGALLATADVAAERITLAAEVALVNQRMAALASVMEAIDGAKSALAARLAETSGPVRALLQRQMDLLSLQEAAILEKAGVGPAAVREAIQGADASPERREGARGRPRLHGNGTRK